MPPSSFKKSPTGACFVRSETKKGILPMILHELLAARKKAKKDMKAATDPMVKAVRSIRVRSARIPIISFFHVSIT